MCATNEKTTSSVSEGSSLNDTEISAISAVSDDESQDNTDESSEEVSEESEPQTPEELYESLVDVNEDFDALPYSAACLAKVKTDSENGYFHVGDIVKIKAKWNEENLAVYATDRSINLIKIADVELLPLDYELSEGEKIVEIPTLPASQVLKEVDDNPGYSYNTYGLPVYTAKDEYKDDYGNSLSVYWTKDDIVKYGKITFDMHGYYVENDIIKGKTLEAGAIVGALNYGPGKPYGYFSLFNSGDQRGIRSLEEYLDEEMTKNP